MKKIFQILVLFGVLQTGCSFHVNFWKDYLPNYQKEIISDNGPWGGHTSIHWNGPDNTFKSIEVIDYAENNGWILTDSLNLAAEKLLQWNKRDYLFFPLSHDGFEKEIPPNFWNSTWDDFPRYIVKNSTLYKYKTGILIIKPGTDEEVEINGFVLLNNDGNEMTIYHLWGE